MKEKLENILRHHKKNKISGENLKSSAVLIPLFYHQGELHVLFTQRTEEVNFHKGQVCFPGGAREPSDASLLQTALREAEEEIGLKAEAVEILGELDDGRTVTSNYLICPFVVFIPYPYPFKIDRKEVKQVFSVPLSALMDKANFKQDYYTFDGSSILVYSYQYEGNVIWGATAMILKQFLELLSPESGALC